MFSKYVLVHAYESEFPYTYKYIQNAESTELHCQSL